MPILWHTDKRSRDLTMDTFDHTLIFGPVPSRRLGRSIGINNIPPKRCSYSCIYCQIGPTYQQQITREPFYKPEIIIQQVQEKIDKTRENNESIDYLTFVADGEPTLDKNLGELIQQLKSFHIPIAVISNASLIYDEAVRKDLNHADLVSLKIDAVDETIWKSINKPHSALHLKNILTGITYFSEQFSGKLLTETMLINGINDSSDHLARIAQLIEHLHPYKSYLSIPIRPTAESSVHPATEQALTTAYSLFQHHHIPTEYLIGFEGDDFAYTGNIEQDILSITSVHPMRKQSIEQLLKKAGKDFTIIKKLIQQDQLVEYTVNDTVFYMRKLSRT